MKKYDVITVNDNNSSSHLSFYFNKYKKIILSIGALVLAGFLVFGAFELYYDYLDHQPLDMSTVKVSETDVRDLISTKLKDPLISEIELDRDNGKLIYDVTVFDSGIEKEFYVDAMTGDIQEKFFD